jgi:hypothetical protein
MTLSITIQYHYAECLGARYRVPQPYTEELLPRPYLVLVSVVELVVSFDPPVFVDFCVSDVRIVVAIVGQTSWRRLKTFLFVADGGTK